MASRRSFRVLAGVVAGLLVVGGGGAAAFADQVVTDGDGTAPLVMGKAVSVNACIGQTVNFDVLVAARRNGNSAKDTFKDNSVIAVTVDSATPGISATLSSTTIAVPAGWGNSPNNTLSTGTVTAKGRLTPTSAAGSGTLTLGFSGINISGDPFLGVSPVTVNWTSNGCDGVAPVLQPAGRHNRRGHRHDGSGGDLFGYCHRRDRAPQPGSDVFARFGLDLRDRLDNRGVFGDRRRRKQANRLIHRGRFRTPQRRPSRRCLTSSSRPSARSRRRPGQALAAEDAVSGALSDLVILASGIELGLDRRP